MAEDLIKRSDVERALINVFTAYNMRYGGTSGGFSQAVPEAIKDIPTVCRLDDTDREV